MNSKTIFSAAAALTMTIAAQAVAQETATEEAATEETRQNASESDRAPHSMMMQDVESGIMSHMADNGMMDEGAMMTDRENMTGEQREAMRDMMKSCHRMMMAMSAEPSAETSQEDGR